MGNDAELDYDEIRSFAQKNADYYLDGEGLKVSEGD